MVTAFVVASVAPKLVSQKEIPAEMYMTRLIRTGFALTMKHLFLLYRRATVTVVTVAANIFTNILLLLFENLM